MAENLSSRFGLLNWGAPTDGPSRLEFNGNFTAVENLAAVDAQGAFASRGSAATRGKYYWDTDNNYLWRDTGSAWWVVGSRTQDSVVKSSAIGVVPLTINAITGQTANLIDAQVNSVSKWSVSAAGNVSANIIGGKSASYVNDTAANVVLFGKGAASQSGLLLSLQNSAGTNMFSVSPAGLVTSPNFATSGSGATAATTINSSTAVNAAGYPSGKWSGTPALDVTLGRSGAFSDFVYIHHPDADNTVATRRIGLVLKVGNEDAAGANHSGALYMESASALFANPSMKIDVQDTLMWTMSPDTNGSVTTFPVFTNGGYFYTSPNGTGAVRMTNSWIGTQNNGNSIYLRAGTTSDGYYFYAAGSHISTAGNPNGGVTMASLLPTGTGAQFSVPRLLVTNVDDVSVAGSTAPLQIGPSNAQNMVFDANEILGRNNGVKSELNLQIDGGDIRIGSTDQVNDKVFLRSRIYINDILIAPGFNPPSAPDQFDIWIDMNVGQGIKYWNGSTWVKVNP